MPPRQVSVRGENQWCNFYIKSTYTLEVEESQELLQHVDVVWSRDEVPK